WALSAWTYLSLVSLIRPQIPPTMVVAKPTPRVATIDGSRWMPPKDEVGAGAGVGFGGGIGSWARAGAASRASRRAAAKEAGRGRRMATSVVFRPRWRPRCGRRATPGPR